MTPTTIPDRILDLAQSSPDADFATITRDGETTRLSRKEAWDEISRYARGISIAGVAPGDIVIVMAPHGWPQQMSFLGAMSMGAVPSFMAPPSAKQAHSVYWAGLTTLLDRIRPRLIVAEAWLAEALQDVCAALDLEVVTPDDLRAVKAGEAALEGAKAREAAGKTVFHKAKPDDIALLQHSSGTTGLKKGVALTHRAILQQVDLYAERLRLDASRHRIASWLPLYHDMGLIACFMTPIVTGVPVFSLDPFEWVSRPWTLFECIEKNQCTHVWMPNFAFHQLVRTRGARNFSLGHVEAFINCSEPCRAETHDLFVDTFADCGVVPQQLQVCYAMAETVFAVSQSDIGVAPKTAVFDGRPALSAGRVLDGVEVSILSDEGVAVAEGAVGEIVLSAPFLFSGYYRDSAATAQKLREGRYFTNDIGALLAGELYILGRNDDLIISRGRNFMAPEIEYAAHGVDGVRPGRCVVFGQESATLGTQAITLVFEIADDDAANAKAMARAVKDAIWRECDLVLNRVTPVEPGWLVKTSSGKISREANRAKYRQQFPQT